jgi:putative heme-binding domain-containing protein
MLPVGVLPAETGGKSLMGRGFTKMLLIACLATCLIGASAIASGQEDSVSPIAELKQIDLANGQKLFRVHCARCHGMLGEGGEGPSLKRSSLSRAPDDESLFEVIQQGIPGTGMPRTFGPNSDELWQVAGYVRSLGQLPTEQMPGNPESGRLVYSGKGACSACHIIDGQGKGVGPELSQVGNRRNLEYLRRALTNPEADQPVTFDMRGRLKAFLTVRLVSPEGEFEGLRVNEDEFSIQLRDLNGALYSFDKRELLSFERAYGHSLMPGYEALLTNIEVNDLISYLMSRKGNQ